MSDCECHSSKHVTFFLSFLFMNELMIGKTRLSHQSNDDDDDVVEDDNVLGLFFLHAWIK